MTLATDILRKEHDVILRMLEATEEVAHRLKRGERVAAETLAGLNEFFRLFADGCHHGKEEDLVFPLLERKGVPREGGPIGVMLYEHELGRLLARQMAQAAEAYRRGAPEAGGQWAEAVYGYASLLRQHIDKENNVLFRAADRLLSQAEQGALAESFEKVEEEKIGPGTHVRLLALMDKLLADIGQGSGQEQRGRIASGAGPAEMKVLTRVVG